MAAIPISIAGWGVREGAMMVAFSYAGLAENDGLIVSILLGAAMFVVGIARAESLALGAGCEALSLRLRKGSNARLCNAQAR